MLIEYGASVNVTDASGYTPLHFACQANQPATLQILLLQGNANPTVRNIITDWVPMHEAAWKGYDKCVQVLLDARAPAKPRTRKNETPADLARTNGFWNLAEQLDEHEDYGKVESFEEDWLHLDIDRSRAISLLKSEGARDGTFLVRKRLNKSGIYVLSLLHDSKTYHFEIVKQGIYFFLDQGPYLLSLEHVVDHYKRFSDGLPCSLKHAIGKANLIFDRKINKFAETVNF